MTRAMLALIAVLVAAPLAVAQAPNGGLQVEYRKSITFAWRGATAAFSLDSQYADAWAKEGNVTVTGRTPGRTSVVIVTGSGTEALPVEVTQPKAAMPQRAQNAAAAESASHGSYDVRYTTEPAAVQQSISLSRRDGDRTMNLHLAGITAIDRRFDHSRQAFPAGYYQLITPRREITFLDKEVNHSPLTLNGSTVRGVHMKQGPWMLHAGYSSFAVFENLFLPSDREGVFGGGYQRSIGKHSTLTPSLFYFTSSGNRTRSGPVGSLLYEYEPGESLRFRAELGISRGIGFSAALDRERPGERFSARFRFQPQNFAALSVNNLHGMFADVFWTRRLSSRTTIDASFSSSRYMEPDFRQSNTTARATVQHRFAGRWTASTGFAFAGFTPGRAGLDIVRTLELPLGLQFDSRHFGSGFKYQYNRHLNRPDAGRQLRGSVRGGGGPIQVSVFADHQTQVASLGQIFSDLPGLRNALERAGVMATTPEDIAAVVRDQAGLLALGYLQGLQINLSPVRFQTGGSLTFGARGRFTPRLNFSSLYTRTDSTHATSQTVIHSGTLSQRIAHGWELYVSYSRFRGSMAGSGWLNRPVATIALHRQLFSVPGFLLPERQGTISGVVFQDDDAQGVFQPGAPVLQDVEVVLDGTRKTRTDRMGLFRFANVPYGSHTVEVVYASDKPYFFTTPSQVEVDANTSVRFGVARALSSVRGIVSNDAGMRLGGIDLTLSRAGRSSVVQTDAEGAFVLSGAYPGAWEAAVNPESVPPGYAVHELKPEAVTVEAAAPGRVQFVIRAFRSISGRVSTADSALAGVAVRLSGATSATVQTDANGAYIFRDLRAGSYRVAVMHAGKTVEQQVHLPEAPAAVKAVDLRVAQ